MSDSQRIRHIDAWRFIAVSMVIAAHVISVSNWSYLASVVPGASRLGRFGDFGVQIFFFISGFVICRGLIEERATTLGVSLKAFYVRRALRIIPPLYLYLAILAALNAADFITIAVPSIGNSALFLCNIYSIDGCPWYVGHTWSLAYEEQFYLVFPLLFITLGLVVRLKILPMMILLMVLTSLGLRWAGAGWSATYLSHMIFMLTGCAAALYWGQLSPWCNRLSTRHWLAILTLLVLCVGLLPGPIEVYVKTVLYPPLIGLLVLGTPVANAGVRAFFQNPLVSYLGKISYTVYLWQQLATSPYPTLSPWWTIVFVVGVWLFAHFSYQYLERPLIAVAHRWSAAIKRRELSKYAAGIKPI